MSLAELCQPKETINGKNMIEEVVRYSCENPRGQSWDMILDSLVSILFDWGMTTPDTILFSE